MDNYFMELEGLTLASFFQPKEKCTTLKCIKYNTRKNQVSGKILPTFKQILCLTFFQVSLMPPIPVLLIISIVLLLLSFMLCQEGARLLKESEYFAGFFGIFVILSDSFKIRTL